MGKRIGLFGGTFDPIHLGHLNLAQEMQRIHHLDEVWFIPAHVNPHKQAGHSAPIQDRLAMIELAIQDYPSFIMKDFETNQPPPSYTIDTIRHFLKEEPNNDYFLIMGDDVAQGFVNWKEPDEIVKLVTLLIGLRYNHSLLISKRASPIVKQAIENGLTQINKMDISSTDIRKGQTEGLDLSHWLPKNVLTYCAKHKLYDKLKKNC